MAYSWKKNASGMYEIYNSTDQRPENRIATGSASILQNYGLSTSNTPTPTQPSVNTTTQPSTNSSTQEKRVEQPKIDSRENDKNATQGAIDRIKQQSIDAVIANVKAFAAKGAGSYELTSYYNMLTPEYQAIARPYMGSNLGATVPTSNVTTVTSSGVQGVVGNAPQQAAKAQLEQLKQALIGIQQANTAGLTSDQRDMLTGQLGDISQSLQGLSSPTSSQNGASPKTGTSASSNSNNQSNTGTVTGTSTSSNKTEDYNKVGDTPTSYYGSQRDADWGGSEQRALTEEKYIENAAKTSGLIDSNFLSKISSDPSIVGFYVNALAYGGYTIGDVLNDMKRRELISTGNTQAQGVKIIDPEMTRSEYQSSAEGQKSIGTASTLLSTFNMQGLMNPEIAKYGSDIPDELFKTLVPLLDNTSQAYKDAVASVKSAFYDIANQQLQATTEQAKSVADYNYGLLKKDIKKKYGILLSDDATKAWAQIEALESNYSDRGIENSGLKSEAVDDYLKGVRKQDQRSREAKLSEEEAQKASFYTASGTSAQIAGLTPEERQKWGLAPSADILAQYDMASLKTRFPDQSEEELKAYRDSILDENNNYRSTLYSKYYSDIAKNKVSKKSTAETQVLQDALNKENAAYRNYDNSQPFSQATTKDNAIVQSGVPTNTQNQTVTTPTPSQPTPSQTTGGTAAAEAAAKISESLSRNVPVTPPTQTTPPASTNNGYSGGSIVDYLSSVGQDSSYTNRAKLASQNNITGYTGTGDQNTQLLNILKGSSNNIPKPTPTTPTTQPVVATPTPAKSGYQGVSVADYLSSIGQDSSYANRAKLAAQKGISGYAGTATQNTQLLKTLRGY